MRIIISALLCLIVCEYGFPQVPNKIRYEIEIHEKGELIKSRKIGLQISILKDSTKGNPVYIEMQTPITNDNGLISIIIGDDSAHVLLGSFSHIDWNSNTYYIMTETLPAMQQLHAIIIHTVNTMIGIYQQIKN